MNCHKKATYCRLKKDPLMKMFDIWLKLTLWLLSFCMRSVLIKQGSWWTWTDLSHHLICSWTARRQREVNFQQINFPSTPPELAAKLASCRGRHCTRLPSLSLMHKASGLIANPETNDFGLVNSRGAIHLEQTEWKISSEKGKKKPCS